MKYILLSLFLFLLIAPVAIGKIGVGIGTGKIVVDEILKPGQIYELPSVTILNTGDEPGQYGVRVTYHQDQEELEPAESWFRFSPKSFELESGGAQVVDIKLDLPLRMEPGKYFAYVEGYPEAKSDNGQTSIGIAAASKLYFEVEAANIFQAVYYKAITFWETYQPWTNRAAILILLIAIYGVFNKYFKLNINLKPKKEPNQDKSNE